MSSNSPRFIERLRSECVRTPGSITLPESKDARVLKAGLELLNEQSFKEVILIGNRKDISDSALASGVDLNPKYGRFVFSTELFPDLPELVSHHFAEYLKEKGKTCNEETLVAQSQSALAQAGELLFNSKTDVVVGGAVLTTAEVIRTAIATVGLQKGQRTVSGSFVLDRIHQGREQLFVFADCGVVISPKVNQLVDIAFQSADTFVRLTGEKPKIAFLSFSTNGSAKDATIDKIQESLKIFREKYPDLDADGEIQFDAAIDSEIGLRKFPESKVAGSANVFIFPDLNSGNIGYKVAQRLGGFEAYGPILQGLAKPFSDLSRGATYQEIKASAYINYLRRYDGRT
jgi:phosphate acetyltransferase